MPLGLLNSHPKTVIATEVDPIHISGFIYILIGQLHFPS